MMNRKDLEGSGRDLILSHYSGIRLEGLRKTTATLSQDSWFPGPDLNPGPPEYEAGVLTTRPQLFVSLIYIKTQNKNIVILRTSNVTYNFCSLFYLITFYRTVLSIRIVNCEFRKHFGKAVLGLF
jgi:hypothetical protein